MARHFGNDDDVRFPSGTATGFTWNGPWTVAWVVKRTTNAGYVRGMGTWQSDAATVIAYCGIITDDAGGDLAYFYDAGTATVCPSSTTVVAANGWTLIVYTKVAGTTAPRFSFYKWPANSWVHENSATSVNPATAVGSTGLFMVDGSNTGGSQSSDTAASMLLNRVMTDSEKLRLPKGRWSQWLVSQDDILVEFPSGRDLFVAGTATVHQMGRQRLRASGVANTTRPAVGDPPGFKFSAINRRS